MSNPSCAPSADLPFSLTIEVRDRCLCLHVQRAARDLSRRFDEAFRPLGIRSGQFSLLISLNRPEPPTLGSVAELLAMDRTTLTANLKPLERDGLLEVRADDKDRRQRRLCLTDRGRALLARAAPIWAGMHDDIDAGVGPEIPERLRADLLSVRRGAA